MGFLDQLHTRRTYVKNNIMSKVIEGMFTYPYSVQQQTTTCKSHKIALVRLEAQQDHRQTERFTSYPFDGLFPSPFPSRQLTYAPRLAWRQAGTGVMTAYLAKPTTVRLHFPVMVHEMGATVGRDSRFVIPGFGDSRKS
jgi:hypothetical protein